MSRHQGLEVKFIQPYVCMQGAMRRYRDTWKFFKAIKEYIIW